MQKTKSGNIGIGTMIQMFFNIGAVSREVWEGLSPQQKEGYYLKVGFQDLKEFYKVTKEGRTHDEAKATRLEMADMCAEEMGYQRHGEIYLPYPNPVCKSGESKQADMAVTSKYIEETSDWESRKEAAQLATAA